jgi:hypothetical protein
MEISNNIHVSAEKYPYIVQWNITGLYLGEIVTK